MQTVQELLRHPSVTAGLIVLVLLLAGMLWSLKRRLDATYRFWAQLSRDAQGANVMQLFKQLYAHLEQVGYNLNQLAALQQETRSLYAQTVSKMAIMRFNPFSETGGDQSFAVAFLSEENSGIVLSSLHAREGTRVYAKPIIHGKSQYKLSEEEKEVLREAIAKHSNS